jgi:quercetin dioxygenase-like cupin family protein
MRRWAKDLNPSRNCEANLTESHQFFQNLPQEVGVIQPDSILSKALTTTDKVKVTIFGFATGQELTEHTAAYPAILQFLDGEADLTLGQDSYTATAGSWAYMPALTPHSLVAKTPVTMLLVMIVA